MHPDERVAQDHYLTPEQFCVWLKGFVSASHHYNLTPEAWEKLKATLSRVRVHKTENYYSYSNSTDQNTKSLLHD